MSFEKFELDGVGFNFNIFHLLWLQDPIFKNNVRIDIPDTIQIKQGQPYFWYYSCDAQIKRRSKTKLNLEEIEKSFVKNKHDNQEICAIWITEKGNQTIFEYLSSTMFCDLISKMSYETIGYIQKFIYPKGSHNQVIKCNWGNRLCFFECFTNKYPLNQLKADIYQRAVTFEMPNGPVECETVKGTQLSQRLELFCGTIVNHVYNVTQNQKNIIQMEIFYKISQKNTFYLLFCSKIKSTASKIQFQQPHFKISNKITSTLINYPKPITLSDISKCVGCDCNRNEIEFSSIKLEQAILQWEKSIDIRRVLNLRKKVSRSQIPQQIKLDSTLSMPRIVRNIFPRLTLEEYQEYRNNIGFLNQEIHLCNNCFVGMDKQLTKEDSSIKPYIGRIQKRSCKTETFDENDIMNIIPSLPTLLPKADLYLGLKNTKNTIDFYSDTKLKKLAISTTHRFANSLFKTTQSSRTAQQNQKDFE